MNKRNELQSVIIELKRDYKKAKEKRDFVAMREIYTELWKRDINRPYPSEGKEEIVFFTEILDDNSIIIPYEISNGGGKICYISLFKFYLNITILDEENDLVEKFLKRESVEFHKRVFKRQLEISPLVFKTLNVKNGDILRIVLDKDELCYELNIYNETDDSVPDLI